MALVEFYIKNYKKNNSIITNETLMQTIPMTDAENVLKDPKVKGEIGKAGSFDFGIEPGHPYFNSLMQMKTIFRIVYSGNTIFRGRVLTIDKGFRSSRSVHCEGSFAFFLDSHQEGVKEEARPSITVLEYLQKIINAHNADVEADKQFELGEVPGKYTSATASEQRVTIPSQKNKQKFGDTNWNSSMDRLEGLLDNFGGYFRVRYNPQNGKSYLDWLDKYYQNALNGQSIEIAKNLIDLSGTTEVENLFTIVVPIGKQDSENVYISDFWPTAKSGHAKVKYIKVPELVTCGLYSDAELNSDYHRKSDYSDAITRYGNIWRTVDFENADTPEKLFAYAKDWIKNNYTPELTQWNVTALDLRTHDSTEQPLLVGDRVLLRHSEVSDVFGGFTIISADYDLYHMDKTKYVIGIPNQIVNASYGVQQKQTQTGKSKGGKPSVSIKPPPPPTTEDPAGEDARIKALLQRQYAAKTDWGEDIALDDPLASLAYNTNGEKLSIPDFYKNTEPYVGDICDASLYYKNPLLVQVDAVKHGLDPNDPKTKAKLISLRMQDKNPSLARKQSTWKAETSRNMTQNLGFTYQEAEVLLNESSGTSWLANLVDDDGNWSEYAYNNGILVRPNTAELKKQAIAARKLLTKSEGPWGGMQVLNGVSGFSLSDNLFSNMLSGWKLNLGDFLKGDGENLTFDIGSMFNLDGVKNIFKLISNALNLDGETGKGKFGKYTNGTWAITFNEPFTYTDIDGNQQTLPAGGVSAADFKIPTIPSFKTKLGLFDKVVTDQADINKLVVNDNAYIKKLNSNNITTGTIVASETGRIHSLYVENLYRSSNSGMGHANYLNCTWAGFKFVPNNTTNKITLQGIRCEGTAYEDLASFNIAATQKYITDVAAAKAEGRGEVYAKNITVSPGQSVTGHLYFQVNGNESTLPRTFTVTASSSSVPSSDIHIRNIEWKSSEPSTDVVAYGIQTAVQSHSTGWVKFDVDVDGTGASRSYRFKLG